MMKNTWLCITEYTNWQKCHEKSLFATEDENARNGAHGIEQLRQVRIGDRLIFYITKKGVIGYYEADSDIFKDSAPIWNGGIFPYRIKIKPIKLLDEHDCIPFSDIKDKISNAQTDKTISDGAAVQGKPMIPLSDKDGAYLISLIERNKD